MDLYDDLMAIMQALSDSASVEEIWGDIRTAVDHDRFIAAENIINRIKTIQETSTDSYIPYSTWAERNERKARLNHPDHRYGWHYIDGIFDATEE